MMNRSTVLSAVALTVSLSAFALAPVNANAAASPGAPAGILGEGMGAAAAPAEPSVPSGGCGTFCIRVWRICYCL